MKNNFVCKFLKCGKKVVISNYWYLFCKMKKLNDQFKIKFPTQYGLSESTAGSSTYDPFSEDYSHLRKTSGENGLSYVRFPYPPLFRKKFSQPHKLTHGEQPQLASGCQVPVAEPADRPPPTRLKFRPDRPTAGQTTDEHIKTIWKKHQIIK